jgi:acetyltransferase-like isoleucine patch superfamily enzyme
VLIGKNVWLGDGVRVLSGVCIGDNAVIAANTVVRDDVPENCVYGATETGRPIRVYDSAGARWTRPGNNP